MNTKLMRAGTALVAIAALAGCSIQQNTDFSELEEQAQHFLDTSALKDSASSFEDSVQGTAMLYLSTNFFGKSAASHDVFIDLEDEVHIEEITVACFGESVIESSARLQGSEKALTHQVRDQVCDGSPTEFKIGTDAASLKFDAVITSGSAPVVVAFIFN